MNVALELLFARLRWPVASVRWWVMQELSALLTTPLSDTVLDRLTQELRACRLEAEAVEVLSIFWMAAKNGWVPPPDLGDAVSRPSMLTDRLLTDMRLGSRANVTPPLTVAPTDYEVPEEFESRQGRDVPRIHYTTVSNLERKFGFPLVRQMAYEWMESKAAYPEAPYQGDLAYFVRPAGDHAIGSFADRTSLRMLTAFIRTMEVARTFWGAPDDLAVWFSRRAVPLEPTLAFLRPTRPTWLPALGHEVGADAASVFGFIKAADVALQALDQQAALLALSTPLHVANHELVELTVVRWRRWGTEPIDAETLWRKFHRRQHQGYGQFGSEDWGLQSRISSLPLRDVIDIDAKAAPMAALHDVERVGYLQRDLYPERLYLPVVTGMEDDLIAEPSGGELSISAAGQAVATLTYWNAGWSPGHPAGTSGLTGTSLVGRLNAPVGEAEETPTAYFYLWRVTRLKRSNGYGPYSEQAPTIGVIEL